MKKFKTLIVILAIILCSIHPTTTYAAQKYYRIRADVCYEIVKGEKLPLYIKGYKNSTKVIWKSSNSKIASVNKKGVVTAKKGGTVVIKATIGNKVYKTTVTVITGENTVYETDVNPSSNNNNRYDFADTIFTDINHKKKTLSVGESIKLKITGTKKKITWKSSNSSIATVSESGLVKAIKPGKATITGSFEYKGDIYENTCKITVSSQWMSVNDLSKYYNVDFMTFSGENGIVYLFEESPDSLDGIVQSYYLENIPTSPEIDVIYGTELRYKWDGEKFLYNVEDLKILGIIKTASR